MKIYDKTNKILESIIVPLVFCSVITFVCQVLVLIYVPSAGDISYIIDGMGVSLCRLIVPVFSFFITFKLTDNLKVYKGLWSVFCLAVFSGSYCAISEKSLYYIFGIAVGLFCAYIFNHFDYKASLIVTALVALILGIGFGKFYNVWDNFLVWILTVISQRGSVSAFLFGVLNNIIQMISNDFSNLVYTKSFGGGVAVDGSLVTGAKHIFSATKDNPSIFVSTYLSGHYLFLFAVCGMMLGLSGELSRNKRYALYFITAMSLFSGNTIFVLLFIFLQSPFLFIYSSFISGGCYLVSNLMKMKLGFIQDGGIIEMFMYMRSPLVFLPVGAVFTVLSYFVFRYGIAKYDISESENIYIPNKLKDFLSHLGGIHNIISIDENGVKLRNVKLINTLELQGEVKEDVFITDDDRLLELRKYIC